MAMLPLAVPLNAPVTPAAGAQEGSALAADSAGEGLDFASLLAAGLAPALLLPDAGQQGAVKTAGNEQEPEQAPAALDAASSLLTAAQLPFHPAQPSQIQDAPTLAGPVTQAEASAAAALASRPMASAGQAEASTEQAEASTAAKPTSKPIGPAAAVAADAAGIAAKGADKARDDASDNVLDAASKVGFKGSAEDLVLRAAAVHGESAMRVEHDPAAMPTQSAPEGAQQTPVASALALSNVEPRTLLEPTAVRDVSAPVQSSEFADAFSQQVLWIADKDAHVAELRLNPPELGPVEVRLTLSGDSASAQFVSPHAEVRSAIESSLVRLRESFAEAGIALGNASVSAESFRDQSAAHSDTRQDGSGYGGEQRAGGRIVNVLSAGTARRGLVDVFA